MHSAGGTPSRSHPLLDFSVKAVAVALVIGAILVVACLFAQTHGLFPGVLGLTRRLQHGLSLLEQGARDLDRRIAEYDSERGGRLRT